MTIVGSRFNHTVKIGSSAARNLLLWTSSG